MTITEKKDIDLCKQMTRSYGTSYFLSTYFFPRSLRERTWVLYAFVRYPDEIVDTQEKDTAQARIRLQEWKDEWKKAYDGEYDVHPILRANARLWKECSIPFEYSDIFLDAMFQDTEKSFYQTYEELETYMYGSATVVGYMMSHIIGYTDGALPYARALGEAFQLTNFLRDVQEDYERGRIYIPQEDMDKFGVKRDDFKNTTMTQEIKDLITYELERNEDLYKESLRGIPLLKKSGRRAVRIAHYMYREIAEKIKKRPERIWTERVRISPYKKLTIIIKHF